MHLSIKKPFQENVFELVIRDSLQPVEIELETGFSVNTLYTATVTVFTDYANISSSQNFSM